MSTTLLLADDSVTIQRVIELTFANEDIRVVSTGDGEAAMRQVAAERPDIVLADVGMPKMDGYQVATAIKQTPALKDIPVLLLTGAFEPIDEARARASGCDGILVKPFEPQQLVGRVKELLAGTRTSALWPANLPTPEPASAPAPVQPASAAAPIVPAPLAPSRAAETQAPVSIPAAASPAAPAAEPADLVHSFQGEFDALDAAIADLDQHGAALTLDETDLGSSLEAGPGVEAAAPARQFGDWDLPKPPPQADPLPASPPAASAWDLDAAELSPLDVEKPPAAPVIAAVSTAAAAAPSPEPKAPASKPKPSTSMASAFSALLAAEQAHPRAAAAAPAPAVSDAAVEDAVRRVLARMTQDTVHRIVLETAERLIKEELDKIRANPT